MKIFKRNQLIILVISLMLITAGYLNFTARNGNNNTVSTNGEIAELGDATLVSTSLDNQSINEAVNDVETNDVSTQNTSTDNTAQTTSDVNANTQTETSATDDEYFTKSRLERDSMYSQMLETYQKMYNDTNSNADQKSEAMKQIANINNIKNGTMIAENLITAKGFEDVVIFVNNDSTSVIVKGKELSPEQIAQIQNIVSRELSTSIENIHISTK